MKILHTNKHNIDMLVVPNEDGTLFISQNGETPIDNAGLMIASMGGVEQVLARCTEVEGNDFKSYINAKNEEKKRIAKEREQRQIESNKVELDKAFAEFNAIERHEGVIDVTKENLAIILRYLNKQNWGLWDLPKTNIGISYNQYDCEGVLATTAKVDEPIDGQTMFKVGGKRGHLNNYESIDGY